VVGQLEMYLDRIIMPTKIRGIANLVAVGLICVQILQEEIPEEYLDQQIMPTTRIVEINHSADSI